MKQAIAVAISGQGRSLANLLKEQARSSYFVAGVISSSIHCAGNQIAEDVGLPLFIGNFSQHSCRNELALWLADHQINWVALAGFLKIFPILDGFRDRVVNIHPALLPKYGGPGMYGLRVHQAVYSAGDKQSGATIHFVSAKYDEGPPIARIYVDIEGLTAEEIAERVFNAECQLYPKVLDGLIHGTLPLKNEVFELQTAKN